MIEKTSTRNIPIDTLRGIACIMLVAYHVIGISPESGLRLSEGLLKDTNEMFAYIRMPLFTFLSGLVYGWRPFAGTWKAFMNGKIQRLIIPMLFVGTGFAILQAVTPGTNNPIEDWKYLHIKPVAHYWFIESLFIIFLIILALEHFKVLATKRGFALAYLGSVTAFLSNIGTIWFSLAGVFYLLPYFLAGLYCTRFPLKFKYSQITGFIIIIVTVLFLILYSQQYIDDRRSFLALFVGTVACIALLLTQSRSEWLASIGYYSYSIYLFHVFFTAAARIGLMHIGVSDITFLFLAGTAAGITGPILTETLANKHNLLRTTLLGKKPLPKN